MPKHGKTKKQKMLADLRRLTMYQSTKKTDLTTHSIPKIKPKQTSLPKITQIKNTRTHVSTVDFRYLSKDLQKTLILTSVIVILELMIKYFLNFR